MGSNPITDYLQRMINRRIAGQYAGPGPTSPDDIGVGAGAPAAPPSTPAAQDGGGNPWMPWTRQLPNMLGGASFNPTPAGPATGYGNPNQAAQRQSFDEARAALDARRAPLPTDVSTKLDPQGALSFAWSGGALQAYDPRKAGGINPTPELTSQLAQSRARGFMGQPGSVSFPTPTNGGTPGPGFSPSQTDWSKVANPMAFSGYTEQPERADIERYLQDPMWREKQTAQIEQNKQVAIVQAQAAAQASQLQAAAEQQRQQTNQLAQQWIDNENKTRIAAGKPPLSLQEQQAYYQMAQQRYSGKYGLV